MADNDGESTTPHLRRDIGLLGASFIVLNGLIGAGIFALPANLVERAGAFSIWLVPLVGFFMFAVVLSFAELASHYQETGGPVLYVERAFGHLAGFQTGWLLYLSRITATAANTNALLLYIAVLWPAVGESGARETALALIFVTLTLINYVGVKRAVRAIDLFSYLKIAPLILFIALGLGHVSGEVVWPESLPEGSDLAGAALLLVYAFIGFEGAPVVAGETRDAKRTVPRALILTVAATALLYFLIQLTYVAVVPAGTDTDAPLVEAGRILAGPTGALVMTLAAIFSLSGNKLNSFLGIPRVTYALAEDGSLPRWFAHVHPRFAIPDHSLLFFAVVGLILAISGSFVWLALASTLSRMIVYGAAIATLPVVRRRPANGDAWLLPGGYLIPAIGFAICLWVAVQSSGEAWLLLAGLMAVGSGLFVVARRTAQAEDADRSSS